MEYETYYEIQILYLENSDKKYSDKKTWKFIIGHNSLSDTKE
jgi:hypothetical protein